MTPLRLVLALVRRRPLTWGFHVLTLAIGVAMVLSLLLADRAAEARFNRDLAGIDLVVGAKGSPLQLVLSAVFQMDTPTGNIPLAEAARIARSGLVRRAIPVSMGDNVRGARIVGTTPDYGALYGATLAKGRWWNRPMEAVVGADAARQLNLEVGQTFVGSHGLSAGGEQHIHSPYRVVGILKPTGAVIDRLVLTDLASVWEVHHHDDDEPEQARNAPPQVTALLVQYRSSMGAVVMPGQVGAIPDLQAAVPAVELARLFSLLGAGADLLKGVGLVILALSAVGFFVALFSAVSQRRRDLALLRAMGAPPGRLMRLVALEAGLLGAAGGLLGVLGARGFMLVVALTSQSGLAGPRFAVPAPGWLDFSAFGAAVLLALAGGLAPALVASRTDPARELSGG